MNTVFVDLMQAPSLVLPVFLVMLFLSAVAVYFIVRYFWRDENDERFAEWEEAAQSRLHERMEAEGRERVDNLSRGSEASHRSDLETKGTLPVGLLDLATNYGFEAFHDQVNSHVILFDRELPEMDPERRVVTFDYDEVVTASNNQMRHKIAVARNTINKRARRAGVTPIKRKAGRPVSRLGAA